MTGKPAWPPLLALSVAALVLVGVPWSFKLLTAPALGEPCGDGFDCAALDGRCVRGESESYCTITWPLIRPTVLAGTWAMVFHLLSYIPITLFGAYYFARAGITMDEIGTAKEQ